MASRKHYNHKYSRPTSKRRQSYVTRKYRRETEFIVAIVALGVLGLSAKFGQAAFTSGLNVGFIFEFVSVLLLPVALYLAYRLAGIYRRWRLLHTEIEDFDRLVPRYGKSLGGKIFEYRLKTMFEVLGYKVKMTWASGDKGTDLILDDRKGHIYSVQAKCWSRKVGLGVVDEAVRGMPYYGCNSSWIITTNYYQPDVAPYAIKQSPPMRLIDRDELALMLQRTKRQLGAIT